MIVNNLYSNKYKMNDYYTDIQILFNRILYINKNDFYIYHTTKEGYSKLKELMCDILKCINMHFRMFKHVYNFDEKMVNDINTYIIENNFLYGFEPMNLRNGYIKEYKKIINHIDYIFTLRVNNYLQLYEINLMPLFRIIRQKLYILRFIEQNSYLEDTIGFNIKDKYEVFLLKQKTKLYIDVTIPYDEYIFINALSDARKVFLTIHNIRYDDNEVTKYDFSNIMRNIYKNIITSNDDTLNKDILKNNSYIYDTPQNYPYDQIDEDIIGTFSIIPPTPIYNNKTYTKHSFFEYI